MSPFWVLQSFTPRAQALALLSARQLECQGYLVRIAQDEDPPRPAPVAFVVLAVWPRCRWLLEFIRWFSSRCWWAGHRWVLRRSFLREGDSARYLWSCHRCRRRCITRTDIAPGGKSHGSL